jgi:hypothetical protein
LTMAREGQAFWRNNGMEHGGRNLLLEVQIKLEQKYRLVLEQETQNMRTSNSLS